jgi:hypothetical protein
MKWSVIVKSLRNATLNDTKERANTSLLRILKSGAILCHTMFFIHKNKMYCIHL